MKDTVHIKGLSELDAKLKNFEPKVRRKMLTQALREGAKVIQAAVRARVPSIWFEESPTRLLKRGNIVFRIRRPRGAPVTTRTAIVTWLTDRKDRRENTPFPFYAHWIEFGSSRFPAIPFLRPGFEVSKSPALDKFQDALKDGIYQELLTNKFRTR